MILHGVTKQFPQFVTTSARRALHSGIADFKLLVFDDFLEASGQMTLFRPSLSQDGCQLESRLGYHRGRALLLR